MEIRQLEYFAAVCEELHFTRAADKLGISQPTLSLQIRAMEQELGTPLFDRIGKRIALTEAGLILLRQSRNIFQTMQDAFNEIEELHEVQGGHLVIGALPAELDYRITPLFIDFHKQFPKIHLKIVSSIEIIKQVLDNELDIGITCIHYPDSRLVITPLYREEYVLVTSEHDELADRESVSLAELRNKLMVMYPKGFMGRELVEGRCNEQGFYLNTVIETTSTPSLFHFVRENIGATIQPYQLSKSMNDPALRLIRIADHPPSRQIGIVYRADKYLGFAAQKFIQAVHDNMVNL